MCVAAEGGGGRQLRSNDLGVDVDEEMKYDPRSARGRGKDVFGQRFAAWTRLPKRILMHICVSLINV